MVLHDHLLHFHVVQPDPIEMEPDVALHIILVQQPIDHFDSVLISVLDSALEGLPPMRHASMAPHMIPLLDPVGYCLQRPGLQAAPKHLLGLGRGC